MGRTDRPESFKQRDWKPRYRSSTCDLLQDFYVPVLRIATRYDRVAGYFRSTSLAAASQGFTALVRQQGRVRMVVGADIDPRDAQVILDHQDGGPLTETLLAALGDPEGLPAPAADGLALLAWMLKAGSLDLRVALPRAVRERLIEIAGVVTRPKEIDGSSEWPVEVPGPTAREWLQFAILREAPHLPNGRLVGMATAPVEPWPHQAIVARRLIAAYPYSFLLCDEVGLGKTIEAGLALRSLLLSGLARRVLIAPPASLARQWQNELATKFFLRFGRALTGPQVRHHYVHPLEEQVAAKSVFAPECVIVPTGLIRRKERQQELAAQSWDIALVDEAHYARRGNSTAGLVVQPK